MPLSLTQLRNKANTRLAAIWPTIVAKQDAYHAKHGKYFQKLITNQPQDEEESDWVDQSPNYEPYPDDAVLVLDGGKLPFALWIDESLGPDGAGWFASVSVKLANDDVYYRRRDNLNNDSGWIKYLNVTPLDYV